MCKYEMDPTSIVEDTERTRFCPQTDKVKPVYPPFQFVEGGGGYNEYIWLSQHNYDFWILDYPQNNAFFFFHLKLPWLKEQKDPKLS